MNEDWKKETIKAVLFVLLILVVGTLTVLLTDNSILLIISGMLIGTVDKIFDKWLDENWREEWYIVKEKINKRTTKDSIEYLELECIVNNRIHDYVSKYHNYPKYIKLPLWIFDCLKQAMCELDLKIDYKTEEFTFFNLKVCETVSIEKPEEIEVF